MRKRALALITLTVALIVLITISFNVKTVRASNDDDYTVERIDHRIEVLYNGYVFINDTVQIVGNASAGTAVLDSFRIGFPYKYGQQALQCIAYDASGSFNATLDVPLENRLGFYAVEIDFSPRLLNISKGSSNVFNVGFILSNNLVNAYGSNSYMVDFPAYPSLAKTVANCSATIVFPGDVGNVTVSRDEETSSNTVYARENLPAFTYSPANVTFSITGEKLQLLDVKGLNREISINGLGEIVGSDDYYMTSKEPDEITVVEVVLPQNSSDVKAYDQFGRKFATDPTLVTGTNVSSLYRVAFTLPVEAYKSTKFTIKYSLPTQLIDTQEGANRFNVTLPLFQHVNYFIDNASVTVVLPEGARMLNSEDTIFGDAYIITKGVFQDAVTINMQGISILADVFPSENILQIVYEYNPLWLSFRPTLWVLALATVGCAVAFIWKRPRAPASIAVPTVTVKLQPEYIRSFVSSYEEKRKTMSELDSLENMVQKGRVPRRRYKVRRKTLEMRLSTLSKGLEESKDKLRSAGGKYADLMRQLEVAETEINEGEANIKSIEARHSRGEISLETYRKLLGDYQHRKETANTTVSGILLRLREELR